MTTMPVPMAYRHDAPRFRVLRERDARREQALIRTATLAAYDAWGARHEIDVEWRAEIVRGVALGHENIGEVPIVWVDHPPVHLTRSVVDGGVDVRRDVVQVTFERQDIVEGCRQPMGRLAPGCFRITGERVIQ